MQNHSVPQNNGGLSGRTTTIKCLVIFGQCWLKPVLHCCLLCSLSSAVDWLEATSYVVHSSATECLHKRLVKVIV